MGKLIEMVHILESWFEAGIEKFKAGTHHPLTDETQSLVDRGVAKIIEVDPDLDRANKARAKADAALAFAKAKADDARVAQEAAEVLDRLAKEAEGDESALRKAKDEQAQAEADAKAQADAEADAKAKADAEAAGAQTSLLDAAALADAEARN